MELSEKVKSMSSTSSAIRKNPALSKKHLSQSTLNTNISKMKNQVTKFVSQPQSSSSLTKSYFDKSQSNKQTRFFNNGSSKSFSSKTNSFSLKWSQQRFESKVETQRFDQVQSKQNVQFTP